MTFAAQMAYDVKHVLCGPADKGEPAEFTARGATSATELPATFWGAVADVELGQGFIADTNEVVIPRSDLATAPARQDELVRYPDGSRETWTVEKCREGDGAWVVRVVRGARARPVTQLRGGA